MSTCYTRKANNDNYGFGVNIIEMNGDELIELIRKADEGLKNYSCNFLKEKIELESQINKSTTILNERTLSFFLNSFFEKYFGSNCILCANEFSIDIEKEDPSNLTEEVGGKAKKESWNHCYVDGYFKIKDLFTGKENGHLFLEYKLQNRFIFSDLATDFLKYKLITKSNEKNTAFVYIIFGKNENYPTIIRNKGKSANFYSLLKRNISPDSMDDTNVFVYLPNGDSKQAGIKIQDSGKLDAGVLYQPFLKFSALSEQYETFERGSYHEYNEKEKMFLDGMRAYNSKVIKSRLIQDHYFYIRELFNEAISIGVFKGTSCYENVSSGDLTKIKEEINAGAQYRANFEQNLKIKQKIEAAKKGLNAQYFSSFNLIVTLDYFRSIFVPSFKRPQYWAKKIGRGNKQESIDYQSVADDQFAELKRIYSSREDKILQLSFQIMYFIVNVYPVIFNINDEDKTIELSANARLHDLIDEMEMILNRVLSLLKSHEIINLREDDFQKPLKTLCTEVINAIDK